MGPKTTSRLGMAAFSALAAAICVNALALQNPRPAGDATPVDVIAPAPAADAAKTAPPPAEIVAAPPPAAEADRPDEKAGLPKPQARPEREAAPPSVEIIRAVQRELQRRGYAVGAEDGRTRIIMREAIIAYEFDRGIALAGEPNETLLKDLLFSPFVPRARRENAPERFERNAALVRSVQDMLSRHGYGPGALSGAMDDATRQALRQFQSDRKLAVNGALSERLLLEIIIVTGSPLVWSEG